MKNYNYLIVGIISLFFINACTKILDRLTDTTRYYSPEEIQYTNYHITENKKNLYIIFSVLPETVYAPISGEVKCNETKLEVRIIRKHIHSKIGRDDDNVQFVGESGYLKDKGFNPYHYYLLIPNKDFDSICFTDNKNTQCY